MTKGQLRGMRTRNEGVFAIRSLFVMPKLLDGGTGAGPKGRDDGVKHFHTAFTLPVHCKIAESTAFYTTTWPCHSPLVSRTLELPALG